MNNIIFFRSNALWNTRNIILAILSLFGIIARAEVYEHRYFNANFPNMDPEHFEVAEKEYIDKLTYQNDSITLKIAVFPLSLSTAHPDLIVREVGHRLTGFEDATETTLCGRKMLKISYTACEPDTILTYSNLYLLSNGEVTLVLGETGNNGFIDWWNDNIDLKINDMPTRSLSERTSDLENFFNKALSQDGSKMKITQNDGHVKIDITDINPSSEDSGERGAILMVYRLINMFSVFEEYAELGYTISIKITDGEDDVVCDNTFTHEQYSTWNDDTFYHESDAEVSDDDEYVAEVEVAILIEPINDFIGIASDGERCGLYDLAGQKFLTEMSYLSLTLSDEGNTDFGYGYIFKCMNEDGSEGEVTVIKGPNYTIAITEGQ